MAGLVAAAGLAGAVFFALPRKTEADLSPYRFTPIATEAGWEAFPAWSPDVKTLAYVAGVGGLRQVFTRNLESPVADQITREDASCSAPFWSPAGDRIYYSKRGELWSVSAIGGAPQKVLDNVGGTALAPDGVSLAVKCSSALLFGRLGGELAQFRKDPFRRDFRARNIAFSPDGTKVAVSFAITNTDQGELWIVPYPPDRGEPRRVFAQVPGEGTLGAFSWMPDSRRLVVTIAEAFAPCRRLRSSAHEIHTMGQPASRRNTLPRYGNNHAARYRDAGRLLTAYTMYIPPLISIV